MLILKTRTLSSGTAMKKVLVTLMASILIELAHAGPPGHWLGILKIKPVTYRIYLRYSEASSQTFYP